MRRHLTFGDLITGSSGLVSGPWFAKGHWIIGLAWLSAGVFLGLWWDVAHEA